MRDKAEETNKIYIMDIKTQTVTVFTNRWVASLFFLLRAVTINLFPHEPTKGQLVEVVADDQALHQLADMALHVKVILQKGSVAACGRKVSYWMGWNTLSRYSAMSRYVNYMRKRAWHKETHNTGWVTKCGSENDSNMVKDRLWGGSRRKKPSCDRGKEGKKRDGRGGTGRLLCRRGKGDIIMVGKMKEMKRWSGEK